MILSREKKDFLIILIGKLLQVIIVFFTIKISTILLSPIEMGNIYIFTAIYTFFVLSFISPLGQFINRHTHKWHENSTIFDNLSIYAVYLFIVSLLSLMIGFAIYSLGISNGISSGIFLLLLIGFVLFLTLNKTIIPILNMLNYRLSFTLFTLLTSLGILVFGYLSVYFFGNSAESWLSGILFSNLVFTVIGYFVLKNKVNEQFSGVRKNFNKITKNRTRIILKFVVPLSIATMFMWLQNSGYRIIIEKNVGLEFLGFFGVGMAISGQIASVVESIIMQYFHPIYYQQITNTTFKNREQAINEFINKVLPIYFMLAIFLTFLAKYILELLVDEKFYEAYIFVVFGIWVDFFRMTTNLFGNISQSEMNTTKFMIPYLIGSLVTIFLVYIVSLGDKYELYLPISLIIGGFFTMVIMYFSMQKLIKFHIDFNLIAFSLLLSIPYFSVLFFELESSYFFNLLVVLIYGSYFLGTIYLIYKKRLNSVNY